MKKLGQATTSATTTKITKSTPYDIHITTSRTTTNANSATIIDKAKTHEDSPTTILRTTTSRVNAGHIINTYDLRFTFDYIELLEMGLRILQSIIITHNRMQRRPV